MRRINWTMMAYNNLEAPCNVAISSDSLFLVWDDWWDTPFVSAVTEPGLESAEDDERAWEFLEAGIQRFREPFGIHSHHDNLST